MRRWIAGISLVLVASLSPALARATEAAASAAASAEARRAYADGKRLYDAGKKRDAVDKFKEAFRLSQNALLLYNIAFVYDELGDRPLALHFYQKFLDKAPANAKTAENRAVAEQRARALPREIAADAPGAAPAEPAAVPAERAAPVGVFTHVVPDSAVASRPLALSARIPPRKRWTLALYFRSAGREDWEKASMQASGEPERLVGRIPTRTLRAGSLHYYIEVLDAKGEVLDRSGSAGSPNVVVLEGDPVAPAARHADGPRRRGRPVLRWTVTGGAAALLGASLIAHITANNYEAARKAEPDGSDKIPEYADGRDRNRTISYVTLGVGVATAGVAGYLWYRDLKADRPTEKRAHKKGIRVSAAPMVGPGVIGSAALVEF